MTGPDDEHRDLDRDDLLAIDVPSLLAGGIGDRAGHLRGEVQGTASTAAAVQIEAEGLPLDMLGRMLTMVNRHTWQAAVADVDVIVEEPARRGYPRAASIVRAGIAACRDGDEYVLFARWLANVYALAALRAATDPGASGGPGTG
jgi:hypothetical protein